MNSLKYYLDRALKEKWALPQFNFSNLEILKAIVETAQELKSPIIIGTSEGESRFVGLEQAVCLVHNFRDQLNLPLFLNLDHGKSFDYCKIAIDKGYDTCNFDSSGLEFEENLNITKKLVDYAKSKDILIEGEIEEIGSERLTDPERAYFFCKETGIQRLAVNIGTGHAREGKIDLLLLKKIKERIKETHLVLHGASGVPEDQIKEAINIGITKINVNTILRKTFTSTLRKVLNEDEDEIVPYKYMPKVIETVKEVVAEKIKLFGSFNKI